MKVLDDLHDDLEKMAREIAVIEPDSERWDTPVIYLIDTLGEEAMKTENGDQGYRMMVEKVRDALTDWLEDERW
jgi:hypothetical protein